jgi:hypothetical protein
MGNSKSWTPSPKAIFEAKVRAYFDEGKGKGRSIWGRSGERLAAKFGITPNELSMILTFSRYCKHPFSDGPCPKCPVSCRPE